MYARKRFVLFVALVLILSAVLVSFQKVNASGTLDQQQPSHPYGVVLRTLPTVQFVGQTFTAGLSGSLTEVDLVIMPGTTACKTSVCGPVTVEIHSGSPTGSLLASTSLPSSALPDWSQDTFTVFTFSTPAQVAAGSVYAIVITTTYSNEGPPYDYYTVGEDAYFGDPPGVYPGGQQFLGYNGPPPTAWSAQDQFDIAFKTYVAAPSAPSAPVGGLMEPVNKLVIITSYVALFGLVATVTVVIVKTWKKPEN